MSRKVFTAGEVLAAADVNSFLMDQTVMSFAGTAARGSAIPSPVTGMYTHLEDAPQRTEFWNGSAWISPFGATLVSQVSFTSSSGVSQNNVFSSQYTNYIVQVNLTSVSTNADIYFRLRAGGTDFSGTSYFYTGISTQAASSSISVDNFQNGSVGYIGTSNSNLASQTTLYNPFLTVNTFYTNHSASIFSSTRNQMNGGLIANTSSYDGLTIYPGSGTITGTIRIYGMRNA